MLSSDRQCDRNKAHSDGRDDECNATQTREEAKDETRSMDVGSGKNNRDGWMAGQAAPPPLTERAVPMSDGLQSRVEGEMQQFQKWDGPNRF